MTNDMSYDPPAVHIAHPLRRARDWQERLEFRQLCDWWRKGGVGICALVGIGGAGKTAIAERFLRILPGVTAADEFLPKSDDLPPPKGIFVFSFYDAPDTEVFFDELYKWLINEFRLTDCRRVASNGICLPASASLVIDGLTHIRRKMLLVLDGSEKIQDNGSRNGTLGRFEDGGIRELFKRTAAGLMPLLGIVMTTRFLLDDLEFEQQRGQAPFFSVVSIDQLPSAACIALLRRRGVRGSDEDLTRLSNECGCHALTVDLAGGYLAHFRFGDPNAKLNLQPPLEEPKDDDDGHRKDDDREHRYTVQEVGEQAVKLNRLATRYHEELKTSNPGALALLQRLCLFREGIGMVTLGRLFIGKGKEAISGSALANLSGQELQTKLSLLQDLRLIETSKSGSIQEDGLGYTVHPAIRENFLRTLGDNKVALGHEAASRELMDTLAGIPNTRLSLQNPRVLDLVEQIIFHTIACGEAQAAWDILWTLLGGYPVLGWRLAAYQRGERLCSSFFPEGLPPRQPLPRSLTNDAHGKLLLMAGLFLKDLGRLRDAQKCFALQKQLREAGGQWSTACTGTQNLAEIALLQGRLGTAESLCQYALDSAARENDLPFPPSIGQVSG